MTIHPRDDWGSRGIWGYVRTSDRIRNRIVVHHSVTNIAGKTPVEQVMEEENIHYSLRNTKHYGSIAYNFVVSRDGQAWEGMGWPRVTVANWWGDDTIAVCIAGNYQPDVPNIETLSPVGEQLAGVAEVIYEGMKAGWIATDATIIGHRQAGKTSCPGDNLFTVLDWIGAALYKMLVDNPITPPATPPYGVAAVNIDVIHLQQMLNTFGGATLIEDGDFGPKTKAAVKAYQAVLGVKVDGVWGPASQAAHEQFLKYLEAQTPVLPAPPPAAEVPLPAPDPSPAPVVEVKAPAPKPTPAPAPPKPDPVSVSAPEPTPVPEPVSVPDPVQGSNDTPTTDTQIPEVAIPNGILNKLTKLWSRLVSYILRTYRK